MRIFDVHPRFPLLALAMALALLLQAVPPAAGPVALAKEGSYRQANLVSDLPGVAGVTDPHLVNPWGLSASPTGPFWISDNGTGLSTVYTGDGHPFPGNAPLVVTIPPPAGGSGAAAPTGNVFNGTSDFVVAAGGKSGAAVFIFATEDGTLSGWNPGVNPTMAVLAADHSAAGAVYKGLALASNASGNFLYATNFRAGTVDVFDTTFTQVTLAGSFTDPNLPAGFAPFGIQAIGGSLYVTYAKQDTAKHDDVAGPGNGFVDVFDTSGHLSRRFASQGTLNSPWGLAMAPTDFGAFSRDLLVGDFGDGRINAFASGSGAFLGQLADDADHPITISGLWAVRFGNGGLAGKRSTLFFTAGLDGEQHGLFGSLEHHGHGP